MTLATIIVPTIGRLEFVEDTKRSVRDQSVASGDIEILVLDNESPPEAARILADWEKTDSRIRLIRISPRIPMYTNFNRGIAESRGKYVTFFHDDDVYTPDFLRRSVEALQQNPGAVFCGSNADFIDEQGNIVEKRRWIRKTGPISGKSYIKDLLSRGRNIMSMPGIVYRRDAIAGGYDDSLSLHYGDYVNLMRFAEDREVVLLAEPLLRPRRHAGQSTHELPFSEAIPMRTRMLLEYCDEFLTRHPQDGPFIEKIRQRIWVHHRAGLLWGWTNAPTPEEMDACARGLERGPVDDALRLLLRVGARTPVRKALRTQQLRNVARRLAGVLGV